MNPRSSIEARIAALISTYADRAPIDVDPIAMTRLAAAASARRGWHVAGFVLAGRGLAFILLLTALLITIVAGALVAGGQLSRRNPEDLLTQRGFIEPFIGVPPEGAAPSIPETGELVFSFGGRVNALAGDLHLLWLYGDGRLIWKSNLEGTPNGAFGSTEPTIAIIEQRLTREGVELLRSEVMRTATDLRPVGVGEDTTAGGRPGVLWGGLTIGDENQLFAASWSDRLLPGRLANPAAWLPPGAWADQRIGGHVPTRYAVCGVILTESGPVDHLPRILPQLPNAVERLLRDKGAAVTGPGPSNCFEVRTDDARAIVSALDAARFPRRAPDYPDYAIGPDVLTLWPILPHGEVPCVTCG